MTSSKKWYCSITKFLKESGKANEELYEIMDELCVLGRLRPNRRYKCITFVIPSKDTIKKVKEKAYGKVDGTVDAINILLSHIFYDRFLTPKDWSDHKDDLTTSMGKHYPLVKVDSKSVYLNGGVKLSIEPKFNAAKNKNLSVWKVESGNLVYDDKFKKATYKYADKCGVTAKGGDPYSVPMTDGIFDKDKYIIKKISEYMIELKNSTTDKFFNPFAEASVSIVEQYPDLGYLVRPAAFSTFCVLLNKLQEQGNLVKWYSSESQPSISFKKLVQDCKSGVEKPTTKWNSICSMNIEGKIKENYKNLYPTEHDLMFKLDLSSYLEVTLLQRVENTEPNNFKCSDAMSYIACICSVLDGSRKIDLQTMKSQNTAVNKHIIQWTDNSGLYPYTECTEKLLDGLPDYKHKPYDSNVCMEYIVQLYKKLNIESKKELIGKLNLSPASGGKPKKSAKKGKPKKSVKKKTKKKKVKGGGESDLEVEDGESDGGASGGELDIISGGESDDEVAGGYDSESDLESDNGVAGGYDHPLDGGNDDIFGGLELDF